MPRLTRFDSRLTFIDVLRVIPPIDGLYQRWYPAHYDYQKQTGLKQYGRVGLSPTKRIHPREGSSAVGDMSNLFDQSFDNISVASVKRFLMVIVSTAIHTLFILPIILQPIADMYKDFIDTFKPYKTDYYRRRDWYQPLHGIKNIVNGALDFITNLVFALLGLIDTVLQCAVSIIALPIILICCAFSETARELFFPILAASIAKPIVYLAFTTASLLEPIVRIFRGVTQVAFFLPAYIFKKSIRHLLTPQGYKGMEKAEDNKTIKMMVEMLEAKPLKVEGSKGASHASDQRLAKAFMLHTIHFKYAKGLGKEKATDEKIKTEEAQLYKSFIDAKQHEIGRGKTHPYNKHYVIYAQDAYEEFVTTSMGPPG